MKKTKFFLIFIVVLTLSLLVGCAVDEPTVDDESFTVTYYDGETVLKTETVKKGERATEWTPEKEGYTFIDWYGEPSMTHKFDFNNAITANTAVFAGFSKESAPETR